MTLSLGLWHWRGKSGVKGNQHDWLPLVRQRYQDISYWVVPWGTTQAKAGVKAEPDDGRWLGVAFGATQVIHYHP